VTPLPTGIRGQGVPVCRTARPFPLSTTTHNPSNRNPPKTVWTEIRHNNPSFASSAPVCLLCACRSFFQLTSHQHLPPTRSFFAANPVFRPSILSSPESNRESHHLAVASREHPAPSTWYRRSAAGIAAGTPSALRCMVHVWSPSAPPPSCRQ
jgi:hypothetical protein